MWRRVALLCVRGCDSACWCVCVCAWVCVREFLASSGVGERQWHNIERQWKSNGTTRKGSVREVEPHGKAVEEQWHHNEGQ